MVRLVVTGGSLSRRSQSSLRCRLAEATWQINEPKLQLVPQLSLPISEFGKLQLNQSTSYNMILLLKSYVFSNWSDFHLNLPRASLAANKRQSLLTTTYTVFIDFTVV